MLILSQHEPCVAWLSPTEDPGTSICVLLLPLVPTLNILGLKPSEAWRLRSEVRSDLILEEKGEGPQKDWAPKESLV